MAVMTVDALYGEFYESNVYLVSKENSALLIDTGLGRPATIARIQKLIASRKIDELHIVLTHRHCDHVGGVPPLLRALANIQVHVYAHELEAPALAAGDSTLGCKSFGLAPMRIEALPLTQGNKKFGSIEARIIHTPGHTSGSICVSFEGVHLFSGDTIFANGSVGRWDLPTGNYSDLRLSVSNIVALGNFKSLYPGHGPWVTNDAMKHIRMAYQAMLHMRHGE